MATLSVLTPTTSNGVGGLQHSYTSPALAGDDFPNLAGDAILEIKNGSSAGITVTVTGQLDENGRNPNSTFTLAATSEGSYGPFQRSLFNNGSGNVEFSLSGTSTVSVCVYRPFRPAR